MAFHKLLNRQISKYLTPDCIENPVFKDFIQAVNDSYLSFERDKELMNHAFNESEIEYHNINESLNNEFELKKQSISNLYDSLEVLEDGFDEIKNDDDVDDLLFISKYLNKQIEKRKEFENNLSRNVELLKTLLANLPSGIKVEDENRNILYINQLYCDILKIPSKAKDMIGQDCSKLTEEYKNIFVSPTKFSNNADQYIKKRKVVTNSLLETIDGRFLEQDFIPIFINKEYKGNLWKYTDVTERINIQSLLEQSEERNRLIMNSALNAILTIDKNGLITFWNDSAEKIFGWKRDDIFGKKLINTMFSEENTEATDIEIKHFIKQGQELVLNKQIEVIGINKNGNEFPIEISIIPVKQGKSIFFCAFIQDISKRKKAENNLKYQEEKYRNIIANMNLGLIEVDNNEIIQFANQSFSEISGYEINELIGKNPSEVFIFGENFEIMQSKKVVRKLGVSDVYQIPVKNKRGELKWWAISGAPNFDDQGNLVGTIGIHLDITDQKQLEIDLENEKIKAEEASKAKEAFLANMSHEIRTPLNAIIGFLRELEKHELSDLQKKYIENSSIASKHLLAIINNILDISKIEAGEMSINDEDFILENSIQSVVTVLQPKAEQKSIDLNINYDSKISKVLKGDPLRIEQILFNLIGNSLKFTQKGEINVNCTLLLEDPISEEICISIVDTGIGMDKKFTESIFKKFSQEDKKITRKFGGTGLGMAITKELVNLMNGRIEVESEKNVGTKIYIYLTFQKGKQENIKAALSNKELTNIDGAKILLVEDNELNRMVAQNSLQYFNCKVDEAENGLEAIEILKTKEFDIILMDIQMPEMDGIEATKFIRNKLNIKTPIIALTANAFKTEIEKCRKAGMDDYVTKPFDETILLETIAKLLNRKDEKEITLKINNMPEDTWLYSMSSINNLSRGNEEFVQKMIAIFIDQTLDTIEKVERALLTNDYPEVSRLIHKIKPSIEGMGILSILDDVKLLEKITKENNKNYDKEEIYSLYSTIKFTLEKVVLLLKENEVK
jgi:PAS domain S-box-containing protein